MDWLTILWYTCYALVFIGLCSFGIHRYEIIFLYFKHRHHAPKPREIFRELPVVTVQLPIFNELYVVERLLEAVAALDYPREKLHIQLLDDSTDDTVDFARAKMADLAQRGFDVDYIHREDRTGFKAGALENGTLSAKGELLYILDADFVPSPDVLKKMVHYFTDEKIGMVQSRWGHLNGNYSPLTKVQAMFLDGHLQLEQTARSRSGRFFNFNGTAGIWRKSCIADAGGWDHDTLTEDLDLSYRAQMKGWRFVYLNDVVTPAELPVDMDGFKNQQHRWTKGSVQVCKKILGTVLFSKEPFLVKLESISHLTANFSYLLIFMLFFLMFPMNISTEEATFRYYLSIPIFVLATVSVWGFYAYSQWALYPQTWWKRLLWLPLLLALGVGMSVNNGKAVLEAIFNHHTGFVRTPKYGIANKKQNIRRKKYSALKSMALVLEMLLAGYFFYLLYLTAISGNWGLLPFIFLFFFGFAYVSYGSLQRMLPAVFLTTKDNDDNGNSNISLAKAA